MAAGSTRRRSLGLLGATVTGRQTAVIGAWYAVLAAVILVWLPGTIGELSESFTFAGVLHAVGLLFGLFAAFFALTQFVLMGRLLWVERTFGADHLAAYHRINGYLAIIFIVLHPLLIVYSHSLQNHTGYAAEYAATLANYAFTPLALLGEVLFVLVVVSSVYIARKHLKYEAWYGVHLLVYVAIVVSFFHQVVVGDTFVGHPALTAFWYAVYGFVAVNIVWYRALVPLIDALRHGFVVTKVRQETPTVTSLFITGRHMDSWRAEAGQYVYIRILQRGYVWSEHPFSISQLPDANGTLRLSIRWSGDFTNKIGGVKAGAHIEVSRAFGKFTHESARQAKRLYIAGGIGITPMIPLIGESLEAGVPATLLYGLTVASDVPLRADVDALAARGLDARYFYSAGPVPDGAREGYVTRDAIAELVPDYADRDIYICGPPVMMYSIVDALLAAGVAEDRLHYERFALHDQRKGKRTPSPAPTLRPASVRK